MDLIEKAKQVLGEYYDTLSEIDTMAVADALEELKASAEKLADALTDLAYSE